MLYQMCGELAQQPLKKKTSSSLFCPTRFTQKVRKRPRPKIVHLQNSKIIEKPYYEGFRCDENVTESGMVILDLDNDFDFEFVYGWLIGEGLEAMLWTTASHTFAEPRLRLVIPLAETVDGACMK